MARRVRTGDRLNITAAEYNRLLAAADAIARDRLSGGGGNRTHVRDAATVRVQYQSATTVPIGGIVGFDAPLGDPDVGPMDLARFVRDATIQSVRPIADEHLGRFGVAIEPIAEDKVGRVVFAGVVAARVNIQETWHQYADVANSGGTTLQSKPDGSAQILWRRDENQIGIQWAVVRVGKPAHTVFLVRVPAGGIPPRTNLQTGSAVCELMTLDESGEIQAMVDASDNPVKILARNPSTQRIRGPIPSIHDDQFLLVTYDRRGAWLLHPPKQTLLCKPTTRIRSKSWGFARELRFVGGFWQASGNRISIYNLCDYALLPTQHVAAHFHEDTRSYIALSPRCCDDNSGSSSQDSSSTSFSTSFSDSISESLSDSKSESTSQSASASVSDSRSRDSNSGSDSDSTDDESGSDKSTAIVPASFTPGGFTALFTEECPEVRFDDVLLVTMTGRTAAVPIDPKFVEVCEKNSIEVCAAQPDRPLMVGARVNGSHVHVKLSEESQTPVRIVLRLTAIRRGFAGLRFPNRTREQFEANERFLQSAYPGAGS
jgi:hypothetical protein